MIADLSLSGDEGNEDDDDDDDDEDEVMLLIVVVVVVGLGERVEEAVEYEVEAVFENASVADAVVIVFGAVFSFRSGSSWSSSKSAAVGAVADAFDANASASEAPHPSDVSGTSFDFDRFCFFNDAFFLLVLSFPSLLLFPLLLLLLPLLLMMTFG